jgi:hypothetical protein
MVCLFDIIAKIQPPNQISKSSVGLVETDIPCLHIEKLRIAILHLKKIIHIGC